ncbi:hypothetical protein BMS3Abin01_00210 [bacterium BMS3Abin01]|nr:hypothetical protein BMS3Abin01_00210 [bacterium BMS3Abin01]
MAALLPGDHIGSVENGKEAAISINAARFNRNLLIFLIACEIFLVIIDATINYSRWIDISAIRRLSNIAREDGVGTWFMSTQTLLAGLTLLLIFLVQRGRGVRRRVLAGWLLLAGFFIWMAVDDASQIHERLGSTFKAAVEASGDGPATGLGRVLDVFPSYPWQLILMPVFALAGLFLLNFLWDQLDDNRARVKLIAALGCFAVAVGLDFIEGLEPENSFNLYAIIKGSTALSGDFVDHFSKSLEETLEMLGMTIFLSIFFLYLSRAGRFLVEFTGVTRPTGNG